MNLHSLKQTLILGVGVAIAPLFMTNSAQAFTWTLNGATTDQGSITISGSFTFDAVNNEDSANPALTAGSVVVGDGTVNDVTYSYLNVDPISSPVSGLSWNIPNGTGGCTSASCTLSLNFDQDLTSAGGTVDIALSTAFNQNNNPPGNGTGGTITASGGISSLPFEFNEGLAGLVGFGIMGLGHWWRNRK